MNEGSINREAMGRIAKTLAFMRRADDPTVMALQTACETGLSADIKKARALFLRLKPAERKSALSMLGDE